MPQGPTSQPLTPGLMASRLTAGESSVVGNFLDKVCVALRVLMSAEEGDREDALREVKVQVGLWQNDLEKLRLVDRAGRREVEESERVIKENEGGCKRLQDEIRELKAALLAARQVKSNKEDYEASSKLVNEWPPLRQSRAEIEAIGRSMDEVKEGAKAQDGTLELKGNNSRSCCRPYQT